MFNNHIRRSVLPNILFKEQHRRNVEKVKKKTETYSGVIVARAIEEAVPLY
jgi:hypothetical protein